MERPQHRKTYQKADIGIATFSLQVETRILDVIHEFHKTSGNNKQKIEAGDIVLVHNDCQKNYWKLAIIESLIYGKDNVVRAANIRTVNGRTN